ncbi:MAG: hypothetical protein JWN98_1024 [Abditibacteriota bacterium]|nr:hypothetical protein [Abditibacteriota bacterium]
MAGHSKWKNIRLHKGKADLERGKIFGKLSREITIAARNGGNPDSNARLRLAIDKAKENSMPADNIKRAVQKGTGELGGEGQYEEVTYEGYGPGGVAVLVEAATDNRNRTVADIRHVFTRNGGSLGESGSVAWQFERKGRVAVALEGTEEDAVMEMALEAGAEDFASDDEAYNITTSVEGLTAVAAALRAQGLKVLSEESELVPQNTIQIEGDIAHKMLRLMDALEDHDDVQNVAANFDIEDNVLQAGAV